MPDDAVQYSLFVRPEVSARLGTSHLKHTFGHVDCPACEATRSLSMYDPEKLKLLLFSEAAKQWLDSRKLYLKTRTFEGYELHVEHLSRFFGRLALYKIHIGHLREYQHARLNNEGGLWAKKAGPSIVNHELSVVQMILKRAGEWQKIAPHYEALRTPAPKSPKVLSDTDEMMVFEVASRHPDTQLAYWIASITCNTGASGTELRNVQLRELYLDARIPFFLIKPETAKNDERGRPVVLNATAEKQFRRCLERAQKLGAGHPDHYLFPLRLAPGKWDPTQPASSSWLRRSWDELRKAVGMPWLTPHCFRHQHITLRIESGDPIEIVAKDVGHSATAMTRYYTHIRRERQQESVNKIDPSVRFGVRGVRVNDRVARSG